MEMSKRLAIAWRVLTYKPGNLLAHASRELPPENGDEMQALFNDHIRELVLVFASQGHSEFSAARAAAAAGELFRYRPLRPLTGEPGEWMQVSPDLWQNVRCSRVFKDADGRAYDIEGRVFRDPDGCTYVSRDSHVEITFPYTPKTEYVSRT